jgi:hypothetical protein
MSGRRCSRENWRWCVSFGSSERVKENNRLESVEVQSRNEENGLQTCEV